MNLFSTWPVLIFCSSLLSCHNFENTFCLFGIERVGRGDGSVVKASATEADHLSPVPASPHGAGKELTSKVVF